MAALSCLRRRAHRTSTTGWDSNLLSGAPRLTRHPVAVMSDHLSSYPGRLSSDVQEIHSPGGFNHANDISALQPLPNRVVMTAGGALDKHPRARLVRSVADEPRQRPQLFEPMYRSAPSAIPLRIEIVRQIEPRGTGRVGICSDRYRRPFIGVADNLEVLRGGKMVDFFADGIAQGKDCEWR